MFSIHPLRIFAGVLLLVMASAGAQNRSLDHLSRIKQLELENRNLKLQVKTLTKSYADALLREDINRETLKKINKQLAFIGKDFYANIDTKILNAVSDLHIVREKLTEIETATSELIPTIKAYLKSAIAADPQSRLGVEVKIRDLEVALGERERPKRKVVQGTASEARVVTIDLATKCLVINVGKKAEVSVGTKFRIERSGTHIGDAIVAAVRPDVSGLLILSVIDDEVPVQVGDLAKVITDNSDPKD